MYHQNMSRRSLIGVVVGCIVGFSILAKPTRGAQILTVEEMAEMKGASACANRCCSVGGGCPYPCWQSSGSSFDRIIPTSSTVCSWTDTPTDICNYNLVWLLCGQQYSYITLLHCQINAYGAYIGPWQACQCNPGLSDICD
jgi:hypothetical protein